MTWNEPEQRNSFLEVTSLSRIVNDARNVLLTICKQIEYDTKCICAVFQ